MSVLDLLAHCLLAQHIECTREQALERTEGVFLESDFYLCEILPVVDLTSKFKELMQSIAIISDVEADLDANWPFLEALNRFINSQ